MTPTEPTGIAFLCDPQGRILRVIRDQLGLEDLFAPDRFFPAAVDRESTAKSLGFLEEIRKHGAAFNWTLNCPINGEITSIYFAGGADARGTIVVVGARSQADVLPLYDDLMRMNNEQVNALRMALKDRITSDATAEGDSRLYEELSRLNNELATAQRELARKNAELARLNQLKNQFLGIAAHDLRSPLGVIMACSEFLIEAIPDKVDAEELMFLETIHSSSQFMRRLVNDLLDIVKIEAGTLELELEPADIREVLRRNISLNRIFAERKKIALIFDELEGPMPPLLIDVAKIDQVLNNLISNGIKFSHPGTTIRVGMELHDDAVVIVVADEGEGIAAHELEKLFRPFETTSTRSTAGETGAGLGLAIVRKIVEGHRGRIDVESTPGRGSTFRVSLPLGPT